MIIYCLYNLDLCQSKYYYECTTKPENKKNSKAQCKASVKVITDSDGNNISIEKIPKLTDHSLICDESRVIKWRIMLDLENEYCKDTVTLPSIVRKKVILKYKQEYRNSEIWQEVQALLPSDDSIDRRLRQIRFRNLGRIPKSRDSLDIGRLLDNLKEWGAENILILDSSEMWKQCGEFRKQFIGENAPPRVIVLTTLTLLQQLAISNKWSMVIFHQFYIIRILYVP